MSVRFFEVETHIRIAAVQMHMIPPPHTSRRCCLVQSSRPFHIVQASPEFASYFGYDVHELHGRSMKLLQGSECGTVRFEDTIKALKSGKEQESELDVNKKDGSGARARIKISLLRNLADVEVSLAVISIEPTIKHFLVHADNDYDSRARPYTSHKALNIEAQHRICMHQKTHHTRDNPSTNPSSMPRQPTFCATSKSAEESTDKLRCLLSRASCQICKALLARKGHQSIQRCTSRDCSSHGSSSAYGDG